MVSSAESRCDNEWTFRAKSMEEKMTSTALLFFFESANTKTAHLVPPSS